MWKIIQFCFVALILLSPIHSPAQKKDRIRYKADELYEFRKNGQKIRRLIGNVIFTQETSTMYCDSSLYYVKENMMEAYGSVRIIDDSVTITSRKLVYDGNSRDAQLREDVIYRKGEQKLITDFLDYNMDTEVGNYFNNGTLSDLTNTLKSEIGYFYGQADYALFWTSVVLDAPDYTLKTDTLRYNTLTKVAISTGETTIITEDESVLHADGGVFRTEFDQSDFIDGNIETTDYYMEADELFFDDLRKYYDAKGNVKLTAKNDDVIITGDKGYNDDKNGISKVYGNAVMRRVLEEDTLYLSADTLVSIESEYDSAKRILAYPNVKVWRYNLQGLSDSAAYHLQDSLLYFYFDPIFWNYENQIKGDTVVVEITEEEIKSMDLLQNSFLTSQDTLLNFNQVKGRTMRAIFKESEIQRIHVNGNCESIYYVLDENDPSDVFTLGMNRILCSNMTLRFRDQEIYNISFYVKPEAKFIPPHELTPEIQRLKNFNWRDDERPSLEDVLQGTSVKRADDKEAAPSLPPPEKITIEEMSRNSKKLKTPKKGG
ncbi:MAG: Organic solvent tolerance protein OstA [Ekhidna sp.]|nr:Organic solvent tolerance protein OstA [Ekhidna sp.]